MDAEGYMVRSLLAQAVSIVTVACAGCGSHAASTGGDAAPSGAVGSSPDAAGTVGTDGSPGSDGSGPGGDGGGVPGVEAGSDASSTAASTAVLTYHNDVGRTGQYTVETTLTPSNVGASTFGKKFSQPVDSYVYAQPLFVPGLTIGGGTHDVVFVETEANSVYAFDADAEEPVLWHTNVGTALSCSDLDDCGDLVPGAGITGTPVIDPSTQTMYLVALTKDSSGSHHRLHALDLTTGAEKFGGPVEVAPTVPGTGANSDGGMIVFDPSTHYQRCALLLTGGVVYIGVGANAESDSDNHGWILGYRASDLTATMTFCTSPDDYWSSMWQSGGGLSSDADGYVYGESANGTFDVNTGGSDYGDSALKLDSTGKVVDYFTPHDQADLSNNDIDFGSANALVLPDQTGPVAHELLASGKPGILFLLDRDGMGHFQSGSDSQIVQSVSAFPNTSGVTSGIFASPVYWNGTVYASGIGGGVQAYALGAGKLSSSPTSQNIHQQFRFPGATLAVSSSGTAAGILWVLDGNAGVLYAYDATNVAMELYDTTQAASGRDTPGQPVKFAVPTVAGGHVYVGTQTELDVYGLLQ
jgi:hypothetical protein